MEEFMRKAPAVDRKISEIKIGDSRIRVVGLVVDKKEGELMLDDGTGQVTVFFDDLALATDVSVGSKIRVFGVPLNVAGKHELQAEIIQKVDKLDLELYDEVRREIKKFEKGLEQ